MGATTRNGDKATSGGCDDNARTPLHELVDLCRERGLALDISVYGLDEGQHPDSDDTKSRYIGGTRLTGQKGDPMDVIRGALRALLIGGAA